MSGMPCKLNCHCGRHTRSPQHVENLSRARIAGQASWRAGVDQYYRDNPGIGYFRLVGGTEGDLYASLLSPLGYLREFHVQWGPQRGDRYKLDFALPKYPSNPQLGGIDIELDGPYHVASKDADYIRDGRLRAMGWKVIRIKHE